MFSSLVLIKSQSFYGPEYLGYDVYKCYSSGITYFFIHLYETGRLEGIKWKECPIPVGIKL